MLSNGDLERLIAEKRCEIEKEKIVLGLSAASDACQLQDIENQDGGQKAQRSQKSVSIAEDRSTSEDVKKKEQEEKTEIPADLERYIRRYLGLPVMLKAGEYSPNNPLVRAAERGAGGDVLLGLGEYERRRNTLRKIRQQQYREYLDQQAKIKQEAKEQAERERREREEKERQREEERERTRQLIEQQNIERERVRQQTEESKRKEENVEKRASVCYVPTSNTNVTNSYRNKVDTGVQVGVSKPLSVGVQTDDAELYRLSPSPTKFQLTQAERELSPRTVEDHEKPAYHNEKPTYHSERPTYNSEKPTYNSEKSAYHSEKPAYSSEKPTYNSEKPTYNSEEPRYNSEKPVYHEKLTYQDDRPLNNQNRSTYDNFKPAPQEERPNYYTIRSTIDDDRPIQPAAWAGDEWDDKQVKSARRRSYGDFDERSSSLLKKSSKDRLVSDLRHVYKPSIFDADAIQLRNQQAEKEAQERRLFYQQELKNQIQEQQRIRDERKNREKLLEAAEMRRLEQQLRVLRGARATEEHTIRDLDHKMKESATDFERKRTTLQKDIDNEQKKLLRAHTQPHQHTHTHTHPHTSHSETNVKLPAFTHREKRLPFSTNISETSIFNPNYDVDTYLRKNLNPKKETYSNFEIPSDRKIVVEKALIHDRPKERPREKPKYEPTFLRNLDEIQDETPIPVLRHSPKTTPSSNIEECKSSDGMRLVEDKWKVPAVQKNILKSLPKDDGKSVNILTQLGSIRRQLQLEQLRLDNLMSKSD